jgi:predicted PurR-regulated permease PerM
VPPRYRGDVQILLDETAAIWNAFIRGQAILALIIGLTAWIVLTALGVRFSLALGLIAGVLEFVPMFGPLISAVAAVLVALFQGSNIWGISQLGFGLIVLAIFMLIQQIENNVLVPRIIGRSLNLHPLTVLVALLGGGVIGGVLGLLLAAPTVATTRTCLGYVYRKAVGLETWPVSYSTVPDPPEGFGSRWRRWLRRRGAKESSGDADQATAEVE